MGNIHILSEKVANKIAAGEVIERPASIVKELIENSLDAGSKSIEITIKHGGRSLIRISDDGCGMSAGDAELSFQRHATSKIEDEKDLMKLTSFGFRGEALPSIAAVSRLTMVTRSKEEESGVEITVEGGSITKVKESPVRIGTTIEVRDLFFNTPARKKFLKQDSTEFGHIMDTITSMALANLEVRFVLKAEEKNVFDLMPTKDLKTRARMIFGDDWAEHSIEVHGEIPHISVKGLIGKPFLARSNRNDQYFFINKRWVKSPGLSFGLQAGYQGLLMHGQFPVAILFIELNPEHVDVNVHPTKKQVRLSHEPTIKSLIHKIVADALTGGSDLAPSFGGPKKESIFTRSDSSKKTQNSFKQFERMNSPVSNVGDIDERETVLISESSEEELLLAEGPLKVTKVLGQIHRTFILAETKEGYILVDQHAAHERVMFEILMNILETSNPLKQHLLMDEILEFHPREVETFKKSLPMLKGIGFDIEPFGDGSFVVRAVPAVFKDINAVQLIKQYVEEKEEGKVHTDLDQREKDIAALVACKQRSVKAHDPLTEAEMKSLLERLSGSKNPFSCPHGRPTFMKYSFTELEKFFKRK